MRGIETAGRGAPRVKVCFLIRQLNLGGAQRQLLELIQGLDRTRFSITVVTFYAGGFFSQRLTEIPGVNVVCLDKKGRWDILPFLLRAITIVRCLRPGILYSFLGGANILSALLKPLLFKTMIVWGVRGSAIDAGKYDWAARATSAVEGLLSRVPRVIIANSRAGAAAVITQGFPRGKLVVVPNGIDCQYFRPQPDAGQRVRHEWGLTGGEKIVGLVGRSDPMKDHASFLRAGNILQGFHSGLCLVMVGGEAERVSELRTLMTELGLERSCLQVEAREDMAAVYNAFDILVSSSAFGEGFPNVVGEAMACGIPCVVTDVGDAASVVADTGRIVPPRDPVALAAAIDSMLRALELEPAIGKRARNRIKSEFNVTRMVAETTKILLARS